MLHLRLFGYFPCIHKTCEMYSNPSTSICTSHHIPHPPGDGLVVCRSRFIQPWAHILGDLWPGWWASLYMYCIPGLQDRSYASIRPEKKGVDPSMTTDTSYHNRHLPVNGLVVCKSCKILARSLGGLWPGWRVSQYMNYIPGLWCLSHAFIRHVKYMATHPCPLVPHIISHTSLWMAWCFADEPVSPGPTSWEVCGLDGEHLFVWIASQACQTLHIHQQDI